MKKFLLPLAAQLMLAAPLALAGNAAPAASASPTPAAPTPAPAKTPATVNPRVAVDNLSDADAQKALELLRSSYVRRAAFDDAALNRATLQGLLERLGGGASIRSEEQAKESDSPFRSEILDEKIGYVRLGSLTKGHLAEFDAALGNFNAKKISSLILDLRATPTNSDFELAAEVVKRLTPKGKMLFAVHRPSAKQEQMFTSDRDPAFHGVVVTLVHRETAGAPEVAAAVLRVVDNALAVGQKTSGQAAEFMTLPLSGGKVLRVAVAEVKLPQDFPIFPDGLKPDIAVDVSAKDEQEVLKTGLEKGVAGLVYETERARMNEAALVAGTNPEIDAEEESQRNSGDNGADQHALYDAALQRAVDLVTTIRIFAAKTP
ncbi:MAG: S41 family peptidase [Chthoniobacteraceae bacterium]|nr:S41 family peptidase [Chthoniobacteraceae bacterium]